MRSAIHSARESFWFLPAIFGVVAILLAQGLVTVDRTFEDSISTFPFFRELSADGGRSILTTVGTSMLTVAGTSFSITISVLATTSSTYGPRLVRNFMADRSNQFVLAMFTSTFLYALVVLRAVRTTIGDRDSFVPTLGIHFAVVIAVVDAAVLVFFIHHIASSVQITTLQSRVQRDLLRAVDHTHPADLAPGWARAEVPPDPRASAIRTIKDGYVQRVDLDDLLRIAAEQDVAFEVVAMPGHYVMGDDPLVRIRGGRAPSDEAMRHVRHAFTIGIERTPEQDVRFALQQLIEIAVRGLASGTNDPYTTVSALDLARLALVPLVTREEAPRARFDEAGILRVVFTWPAVEALISDVFDAVRRYGAEHVSVVQAGLDLAERLGTAARSSAVRDALTGKVNELVAAHEHADHESVDLRAIHSRARGVIAALR